MPSLRCLLMTGFAAAEQRRTASSGAGLCCGIGPLLQLGADDQIRVERELRRRSTSKAVIWGTRTIDIAYEIITTSLLMP